MKIYIYIYAKAWRISEKRKSAFYWIFLAKQLARLKLRPRDGEKYQKWNENIYTYMQRRGEYLRRERALFIGYF